MSWHLQNQVCADADQGFYKSATQFAVMRGLASFADNDGGRCFPSLAKLATRSQCSQPTVKRVLKRFRQDNWIAVKRTGRSNQYQILEHGCVMPQGKEAIVTLQIDQTDPSDRSQRPIRKITVTNDSYQVLSSENLLKEPPPKPPRGVVVVFKDEEGEEVTKEKAVENAPPLRAKQSRSRSSFVTPPLGENPSGFDQRFPSATRGGDQDERSARQPDAVLDVHEQLLARAQECGRPASDAEDVQEGWRNGKIRDRLATFNYREQKGSHPSLEDARRKEAGKTRWEKYTATDRHVTRPIVEGG